MVVRGGGVGGGLLRWRETDLFGHLPLRDSRPFPSARAAPFVAQLGLRIHGRACAICSGVIAITGTAASILPI